MDALNHAKSTFPQGLVLALQAAPAGVSVAPVRFDNGVPVYRFRKELIHCGKFTTADGTPFEVDPELLQHWAATFSNMKAQSVPVPVPINHDRVDGDGNRGFIVDMFPEGEKLIGIVELAGDDAPRLAASNDVSIHAEPEFIDSVGNRYLYPIRHVALTPDPRITGMDKFQAISASGNQPKNVPVLRLSQDSTTSTSKGKQMPDPNMTGDANLLVPPPSTTTPETDTSAAGDPFEVALDAIEKQYLPKIRDKATNPTERKKLAAEMAKKVDGLLKLLGTVDPELDTTETAADGTETAVTDVAACNTPDDLQRKSLSNAVSPELVRLAAENRQMKLEKLVLSGKITPAVRQRLEATFIGQNNAALKVSLSNGTAGQFDGVVAALEANTANVTTGEKTGQQLRKGETTLSNANADRGDKLPADVENDMRKAAGLSPTR